MKIKNKKLSKKSSALITALVSAVVAIVVVIALVTLYPSLIGKSAKQIGEEAICEQSLIAATGLKTIAGKIVDKSGEPPLINCPVEFKDVHEKNIEASSGVKSLNKVLSDDVLFCWSRYGTKEDLYDSSTGNYCAPCKVLKIMAEERFDGFVQYMESEEYIEKMGAGAVLPLNSKAYYDFYSLGEKGKEIAIISTWGKLPGINYLIYNERKQTGILLYPFDDIGELDCYSFEGRLNPAKYKR